MRTVPAIGPAVAVLAAFVTAAGSTACAPPATTDMSVGDCVQMRGAPDNPEATKVDCGSPDSSFKVVAVVQDSAECPADVDSYYSIGSTVDDVTTTVCMDIDWVVGECMSVDPSNDVDPTRVDCGDSTAPHRQRVTEILDDVASADQCDSGTGYAYEAREFTVCMDDVP